MPAWLIKRKRERERQQALEVERQMRAIAAAAEEAAASLQPLTGALANLGEATRKFGEAGALDRKATTAQKIRITDEQLVRLNDPNIDQKLRNYFMEAYRKKEITTWGVREIHATCEREISWKGKREFTLRIIEDLREMLQLDQQQLPTKERQVSLTISFGAIEGRGKRVDEFKDMLVTLMMEWQKATGIPHNLHYEENDKLMQSIITVTTLKSPAEISDARFGGEVKEIIAKAMNY